MIRVDFHLVLREKYVVDILGLIAGLDLIASQSSSEKDKPFNFNWREKISKKNMAFIKLTANGESSLYLYSMISKNGDIFFTMPNGAGKELGFLFNTNAPGKKNNEPLRSLYFLDENTYTAAMATKLVKKIGGRLWINNELKEEYPFNYDLSQASENDDVYYKQKNIWLSTKPLNKEDLMEAMKKYSELNNNDEALIMVADMLEHMEKNAPKTKKIKKLKG